MTNEEAIAILEEQSNFNRRFQHYFEATSVEIKKDKVISPMLVADRYRELAEAMDIAIAKLKNKSMGDPLTLEQLREMDGQPVWVQTPGIERYGRWVIVAGVDTDNGQQTLYCQGDYTCRDYGKTWLAYAYPPAHIDREGWEPCIKCNGKCYFCKFNETSKCGKCKNHEFYSPMFNFCHDCGRPLTDEAWVELEKRLRG